MNTSYSDITSKIKETPKWWDEHAVPRYCDFSPDHVSNIYAHQVALVQILCQSCRTPFLVAFSWNPFDFNIGPIKELKVEDVEKLHYGDPPNYGCCLAGPTMNSVPIKVIEFWRRGGEEYTRLDPVSKLRVCTEGYFEWRRIKELEVEINHGWFKNNL